MRIALFAATALAATAFSAPALAQEADSPFTGLRAEGVVGWDRVKDQDAEGAEDGVVYGGAIGYDVDLGGAVIGAEAELTGSTIESSTSAVLAAGDSLTVGAGRDFFVGGRLGFAAGSALVYAKGGYTNARVNTRYEPATGADTEDHEDLEGWRLGAGVELPISGNVYVKGEYRYSNYGNLDGFDIDLDRHQVVGGVGVRF